MIVKCPEDKSSTFLRKASLLYRDICPEQARFLMQRHQKHGPRLPDCVLCPFCFQWRRPGEYRVRIRAKCTPSPRVGTLLRWKAANKRLGAQQTKALDKFRRSRSILMVTCHICNKTSKHPGMNREFLSTSSKPANSLTSTGKCKTPQSAKTPASKSGSQQKTPGSTPWSKSPETPSVSKSPREKKSAFSRLKKLLMLEDSQKSKKGGLKDFLSSL